MPTCSLDRINNWSLSRSITLEHMMTLTMMTMGCSLKYLSDWTASTSRMNVKYIPFFNYSEMWVVCGNHCSYLAIYW